MSWKADVILFVNQGTKLFYDGKTAGRYIMILEDYLQIGKFMNAFEHITDGEFKPTERISVHMLDAFDALRNSSLLSSEDLEQLLEADNSLEKFQEYHSKSKHSL